MAEVSKSALEAKVMEYFQHVEETAEELIVTDNGRAVVKVVAIRPRLSAADAFGDVRGRVVYREDILAPNTDEWPET